MQPSSVNEGCTSGGMDENYPAEVVMRKRQKNLDGKEVQNGKLKKMIICIL
jgi:hypothetical protein